MPDGRYNPQNKTAVCDEPSPLLKTQMQAAQKIIAANSADATEAAEFLRMCGIFPNQEEIEEFTVAPMSHDGRI
jgi:hypothetical protein